MDDRILGRMINLEFYDPSGATEVTQPHAPRVDSLAGKRIGFVSNEQWQAYRMLPRLKALLEADVAAIEVLAPDAAMVTSPIEMFLPGSDISPVEARKREFYDGLTRWRSAFAGDGAGEAPMVRVEGTSVEDAFARPNHLMLVNRWGDGLPLWPPTRERVDWILCGAAQPRRRKLGSFPPRGGVTTVESCAIALAMAGGRPEYLPVLVAAVEAFLDPESGSEQLQAASASAFPVVIVNGPIGAQIRLNAGFGCLGPDPQHLAGASIGRALRLLPQNLGGALPGIGTMANYGGLRYTNVVFAEDEANLPPGWAPHGTERHGFAPGTSSPATSEERRAS